MIVFGEEKDKVVMHFTGGGKKKRRRRWGIGARLRGVVCCGCKREAQEFEREFK
jgi:hypothetical protein